MQVVSITRNLSRYGGAQKVLTDIHFGIKPDFDTKIVGFQPFDSLHYKYNIEKQDYTQLKHPWQLKGKIILVHSRNLIPFIVITNKLFFLNSKIIYISHNVYNNYRLFTLLPRNVVSISSNVTQNLINYFHYKKYAINLIHNGVQDKFIDFACLHNREGKIYILYAARINKVKQQLQIVRNLRNKIDPKIEIHFAGMGEDFDELKAECETLENFKVLGFVDDMNKIITNYQYIMLYSTQEGLPLSLLEGIMQGKPLLINDVGGNTEIGIPEKNSILLKDNWDELVSSINSLLNVSYDEYISMCQFSRKHFINTFSLNIMLSKYKELIRKVKHQF